MKSGHIIVFRFSALGDVAMTVPVIKNVLQQNPNLQITFISTPFLSPLFSNIERLHFMEVDVKQYKGINGIYKLSKKIKSEVDFSALADIHDVLRTKLLRFFLRAPLTAVIDKGRKEKRELTRPLNKKLRPLKTMFQRYADVFTQLGFNADLNIENGYKVLDTQVSYFPFDKNDYTVIGLAPFAKHNAKMYPLNKMLQVIELLIKNSNNKIVIFCTLNEASLIKLSDVQKNNVFLCAGKFSFEEELNLIAQLDVMVSMDSANMHFSSLYQIPCISIWGGTHPYLGFYGWGQKIEYIIQSDLPCRPSSVFGNKDCPVHGVAGCMQSITPIMIFDKINTVLQAKK